MILEIICMTNTHRDLAICVDKNARNQNPDKVDFDVTCDMKFVEAEEICENKLKIGLV